MHDCDVADNEDAAPDLAKNLHILEPWQHREDHDDPIASREEDHCVVKGRFGGLELLKQTVVAALLRNLVDVLLFHLLDVLNVELHQLVESDWDQQEDKDAKQRETVRHDLPAVIEHCFLVLSAWQKGQRLDFENQFDLP